MDEGLRIFSIISHARRRSLITPHRKNGESRITMRHSPFSLQNSTFQFSLCAPKSTTSFPKKSSAAGAASGALLAFFNRGRRDAVYVCFTFMAFVHTKKDCGIFCCSPACIFGFVTVLSVGFIRYPAAIICDPLVIADLIPRIAAGRCGRVNVIGLAIRCSANL